MLKTIALVFGIVFTLIGILGFIPAFKTDGNLLFGLFEIDAVHNIIHLLSGLAALLAATSEAYSQLYLRLFGVVYGIVTIIGFMQGDTVFGLFAINTADNFLHVVLTLGLLGAGFGIPRHESNVTTTTTTT